MIKYDYGIVEFAGFPFDNIARTQVKPELFSDKFLTLEAEKVDENADTKVDEERTRVCTNWQLITKGRRARKGADNALVNLKSPPAPF